jgi:hypothetical protein
MDATMMPQANTNAGDIQRRPPDSTTTMMSNLPDHRRPRGVLTGTTA